MGAAALQVGVVLVSIGLDVARHPVEQRAAPALALDQKERHQQAADTHRCFYDFGIFADALADALMP